MNKRSALSTVSRPALAVCVLMLASLAAPAQSTADLTGRWGSNIGLTYTITQSGTQWTWTDNNGATGAITLAASGLTTNWTDASGPHSATGVITESDNTTGRPMKIAWSNGVVFLRQPEQLTFSRVARETITATQGVAVKRTRTAALPDLAGTWGSNIGLTYAITQNGTQWTWTDNNGATGAITLAASGLTTNWTDAGGPHSATGVITESDAAGTPKTIAWSNGVVFQRASVAEAEQVALTPIQLPAPVTQPASRTAVTAPPAPASPTPMSTAASLADQLAQLRSMASISQQLLAQVTAPITRREMIETLSASPETRAVLEQVAASVGMTASLLTVKMLDGAYAVGTVLPPNAPPAQALLDLWKAPVHFSPTVPGPSYQAGGAAYIVGTTMCNGIYVRAGDPLQMMVQKDVFKVASYRMICVDIELPPGDGQYVFAIHVVDNKGKIVLTPNWTSVEFPVVDASVLSYRANGTTFETKLSLVPNSTKTALVDLFSEKSAGRPAWTGSGMSRVSITLQLLTRTDVVFAGVTVTRL